MFFKIPRAALAGIVMSALAANSLGVISSPTSASDAI